MTHASNHECFQAGKAKTSEPPRVRGLRRPDVGNPEVRKRQGHGRPAAANPKRRSSRRTLFLQEESGNSHHAQNRPLDQGPSHPAKWYERARVSIRWRRNCDESVERRYVYGESSPNCPAWFPASRMKKGGGRVAECRWPLRPGVLQQPPYERRLEPTPLLNQ